jgi:hypothetical protein
MKSIAVSTLMAAVLWTLSACGQEPKLKAENEKLAAGQPVVIELLNVGKSANASITWRTVPPEGGDFDRPTDGQTKVTFHPSKPGDVVIIVEIHTPAYDQKVSLPLSVSAQSAATPSQAAPTPPQETKPQVSPQPPVHISHCELPARALSIEHIEFMIPSGFMGDAMKENGATASLEAASDCHCGHGCYRVEFKPGTVRWAAFAWQRVPEGDANWGEYPGANLSKAGYRSLRVWAKGELEGGTLPKAQFKSGGNVAPKYASTNRASYTVAGPFVELTNNYEQYCLDLSGKDLSNVVSPFTVVISRASNRQDKVSVLIDDVYFSPEACPSTN